MNANRKTVSVRITGKVQGVWYRAWTQEQAEAHGLSGWVMNEPDGSVSAVLDGPTEQVDDMLRLMEEGPARARVDKVETAPAEPPAKGFVVLR